MTMTRYGLILAWLWMLFAPAHAVIIEVEADRNPVGLDESFQLTFSAAGEPSGDPDFMPLTPYLEIINRSQRSNISVINGLYQSSKSWTLTVMPKQRGNITLPEISFGRDKSPPYELVVKSGVYRKDEPTEMFTQIEFDKTSLYVNQQLLVTHSLFSATNLKSYDLGELSFSDVDAVIEPLGTARQYTKMVGQKPFLVIERRYAVFPLTSGTMQLDTVVSTAEQAVSRGSFYLPFGGAPKVLRSRVGGRQVEVMPAPAAANMNPWLPAEILELDERWDVSPLRFVVGEPVTRTLTVKAAGLPAAQLPDLSKLDIDGVKVYPDQPRINDIRSDNGLTGHSVQKIAFIPVREGRIELPPIEVPWWNTLTNQREVASVPGQVIEVLPGATAPDADADSAPDVTPVQPAASETGASVQSSETPRESSPQPQLLEITSNATPWFFVSMLLSFGWLLTLLAWYIKSGHKLPVARRRPPAPRDSVDSALARLAAACDQRQPMQCRTALLEWARLYHLRDGLAGLRDVASLLQPDAALEVKKIDAMLYGGQRPEIDFDAINNGVKEMMARDKARPADDFEVLEPLYRG